MICQFVHSECRCKDVDLVIHAGDQIYPDDEDIAHADSIFNGIYDSLSEEKQRSMRFRGRELWRNKYRCDSCVSIKRIFKMRKGSSEVTSAV